MIETGISSLPLPEAPADMAFHADRTTQFLTVLLSVIIFLFPCYSSGYGTAYISPELTAASPDLPIELHNPQLIAVDEFGSIFVVDDRLQFDSDHSVSRASSERILIFNTFSLPGSTKPRVLSSMPDGLLIEDQQIWQVGPDGPIRAKLESGQGDVSESSLWRTESVGPQTPGAKLIGPVLGPTGSMYFASGDTGTRFTAQDESSGQVRGSGMVLRCDSNGQNIEVFATGLHSPLDLCFDPSGNLWVLDQGDNKGLNARLIQVVEGGDYGNRSVTESICPADVRTSPASHVLPATQLSVANPTSLAISTIADLASVLTHHVWVGFAPDSSRPGGVDAYPMISEGARLHLGDETPVIENLAPRDMVFGPAGKLYLTETLFSHSNPAATTGRMILVESIHPNPSAATQGFLKIESTELSWSQLSRGLNHPDLLERRKAQNEFARRGKNSLPTLRQIATDRTIATTTRIHALWAMAQCSGRVPEALNDLPILMSDPAQEIRAQAARLAGDKLRIETYSALLPLLNDPSNRVAFFAAQSLGKFRRSDPVPALIETLRRNDNRDPVLSHGVVLALSRLDAAEGLSTAFKDPSAAVRLGAVLVYRLWEDPRVAEFLQDPNPLIARTAAVAINDQSIIPSLPQLAAALNQAPLDDPALVLRCLNAHYRLGTAENAEALAEFASRSYVPSPLRAHALNQLGQWAKPPAGDYVTGLPQTLPSRDPAPARSAMAEFLSQLSGNAPPAVQVASIKAVANLDLPGIGHALWDVVYQNANALPARIAALQALEQIDDLRLEVAAQTAGKSRYPELRLAALPILARRPPGVSLPTITTLLKRGSLAERREALKVLAEMDDPRADEILGQSLEKLMSEQHDPKTELDLISAARKRKDPTIAAKLDALETEWRTSKNPLAPYRSSLHGGTPEVGKQLFHEDRILGCRDCHGTTPRHSSAAPSLQALARRSSREDLLNAIITHPLANSLKGPSPSAPDHPSIKAFPTLDSRQTRDLIAYLMSVEAPPPALRELILRP